MTVTFPPKDEDFEEAGSGAGVEMALPGDILRRRHIATRASSKRKIIVITVPGDEFNGYAIGLDEKTLQILELPSGDVSDVTLAHITSLTDGQPFSDLTRAERDVVDRRTASFRKSSETWLRANWPNVYTRTTESPRGGNNGDPQVWHRASQDRDQSRG